MNFVSVDHYKQQNSSARPIKIKCITLGSAGAGKTSILRRYFQRSFEHSRNPTQGACFYSQRMKNPIYKNNLVGDNFAGSINHRILKAGNDLIGRKKDRRKKKQSKKKSSTQNSHRKKKKRTPVSVSAGGIDDNINTKTSQDQIIEFRSKKLSGETNAASKNDVHWRNDIIQEAHIHLQMWDTAGLERYVSTSSGLSNTLGNSFFRHAHVAMLVYDATSSRSFTQLMKWHSELMDRIQELHGFDQNNYNNEKSNDTSSSINMMKFPVLVVANKLDRIKQEIEKPLAKETVPQRDVLGLNGLFKGKDSRYEYTVSLSPQNNYYCSKDGKGEKYDGKYDQNVSTSLSYGLEGPSWTTDHSYLNSIINADDGSNPDREMVLLWCRRNQLTHLEVSALDGTNIDKAIETVVSLAMEYINHRRHIDEERMTTDLYSNQIRDIRERFEDKDDCNIFKCFYPWCK